MNPMELSRQNITAHGSRAAEALKNDVSELSGKLKLSNVEYWKTSAITPNAYNNTVFEKSKNDTAYWNNLEHDIRTSGQIIEPLIVTSEGVLISGHSRLTIAKKLAAEGRKEFSKVPVRIIDEEIDNETIEKLVIKLNILRFEVDEATRAWALGKLYPELYKTVKNKQDVKEGEKTLEEIAKETGISSRSIRRTRETLHTAKEKADAEQEELAPKHIEEVQQEKRDKRRHAEHTKKNAAPHIPSPFTTDDDIVVDVDPSEPAEEAPGTIINDNEPVYTSENIHPEKNYRYNTDKPSAGIMVMIKYLEDFKNSLTILNDPDSAMQLTAVNEIIGNAEKLLIGMYTQEVEGGKLNKLGQMEFDNAVTGEGEK